MKGVVIFFLSGVLGLILGTLIIVPIFNDIYVSSRGLEAGPDAETKLFDLMIFVQWPIYFVCGALFGLFAYKKYLEKF